MIDGTPVTLLVSSRNRAIMLADAVESVIRGTALPDEIVVIDQSDEPNDRLREMVPPAGVDLRYVTSDTVGISRSRNVAFSLASHQVIVVIDDDCLVHPDWLATIVRALLKAGPRAVVTGRVLAGESEGEGTFAPSLHTRTTSVVYQGRIAVDPLATFNFALHAATYAEIGPFDPRIGPGTRFPSSEDNDYGYRLLLAGYRIVFEPAAVVYHRSWRTARNYLSVRFAYGRGQGGYYGKYFAARDRYMFVKLWHALGRRVRRMSEGGARTVAGEFAWVAGWVVGTAGWLLRPSQRGALFTRSVDGSLGW